MSVWKIPPKIKVYEALGCIADDRIKITGNQAEIISSNRSKKYSVEFDPEHDAVGSNDNASYWQGYYGYPIVAFLLLSGRIKFQPALAKYLRNIPWKSLNEEFKRDYAKVEKHALMMVKERGGDPGAIAAEVETIMHALEKLNMNSMGRRQPPGTK